MKIAVIQGSSQKSKNALLYDCVCKAVKDKEHEVINFGIFSDEALSYNYIQTALNISILLESKAVDFAVTGCSSGQGMMLACNSLPGMMCGYIENPTDAFLFGRINDGNVVSFPLGLNFGWAGEINLQTSLDKLFEEPFGIGYPAEEAVRKQQDTKMLKYINSVSKESLLEVIPKLDSDFVRSVVRRQCVYDYVMKYGKEDDIKTLLKSYWEV